MTKTRLSLLYNPLGGSSREDEMHEFEHRLAERYETQLLAIEEGSDPALLARRAIAEGAEVVVAAGGDGTVSAVASALLGSKAALGIVPRGTANSLAAYFGIDADIDAACATLLAGHRHAIDLARFDERTMLLMASAGVHARAVTQANPRIKSWLGPLAYVLKGMEVFFSQDPFTLRIDYDGNELSCCANALTVSNAAPPTSLLAQGTPRNIADDGKLDVTLVSAERFSEALVTAYQLWRGVQEERHVDDPHVLSFRCRRMKVSVEPQQAWMIDGEEAGVRGEVTIECLPRALRLLVPAEGSLGAQP